MPTLRDRNKQIPNGFVYYVPQTKWKPRRYASIREIALQLAAHRRSNPSLCAKYKWSLDIEQIMREVDEFNAEVCLRMGWRQYVCQTDPVNSEPKMGFHKNIVLSDIGTEAIALAYVHVTNSKEYTPMAKKFCDSYSANPPGIDHRTFILCNGGIVHLQKDTFAGLPNPQFVPHNNVGHDIGAYVALANILQNGPIFCCGSSTHFKKQGWLARVVEAWRKFGPGIYGTLASYEVSPHLPTTGIVIPAELFIHYPHRIATKEDRYFFEHGINSMVLMAIRSGFPVKVVYWDGVYDWPEWRTAKNGYAAGDQSNCLTFYKHSDSYEASDSNEKIRRCKLANTPPNPQLLKCEQP